MWACDRSLIFGASLAWPFAQHAGVILAHLAEPKLGYLLFHPAFACASYSAAW
jgi:hypothetical protein